MSNVVRVEEIVAAFVEQIDRLIPEHADYPLVDERKLAAHGVARDELVRIVRAQIVRRGGGGDLEPRDRHQTAVRVVQLVVLPPVDRHPWKHI